MRNLVGHAGISPRGGRYAVAAVPVLLAAMGALLSPTVAEGTPTAADSAVSSGWPHARQTAELTASDGAVNNNFGESVALTRRGSLAVIGAPQHNQNVGAVYVFRRHGHSWIQAAELTAPDGAPGDSFGTSVALAANGRTVVIGAPGGEPGTVYIFTRGGGWTLSGELPAPGGTGEDFFGGAVAVSAAGSTLVAGAGEGDAAYVFTSTGGTWSQTAELTASDGSARDDFGGAVALSGDGLTAVIGASNHHLLVGAAYVFTEHGGTWSQTDELFPSDTGGAFGISVAISIDASTLVVGASDHDEGAGSAYVFARTGIGWMHTAELTAADAVAGDAFGTSVAVSTEGGTVLVGAAFERHEAGAVYVFTSKLGVTLKQKAELAAADRADGDQFGTSVAVSGSGAGVLAGAPGRVKDTGAAYTFHG